MLQGRERIIDVGQELRQGELPSGRSTKSRTLRGEPAQPFADPVEARTASPSSTAGHG
jgi:hypothetical protein